MRHRAIVILPCLLLGACTHTSTPQFDALFGETSRAALASQVLEPQAGARRMAAHGLDGASARAIIERYRASFAEPTTQPAQPVQFMLGGASGK